ncbi:MAG: hypothetical protein ABI680_09465, partial [Chthoniobacteraceae bacterium]
SKFFERNSIIKIFSVYRIYRECEGLSQVFSLWNATWIKWFFVRFYVRFFSGAIFYGGRAIIATVFAIGIGGYCLSTFVRSIARLLSGETPGAVD